MTRPVACCCVMFCGLLSCAVGQEPISDNFRPADEVQQAVRDVLSDPEYRHLLREKGVVPDSKPVDSQFPKWYRDFLKWLFGDPDKREMNYSPTADIAWGRSLFYLVIAVLVIVVAVLLIGLLIRARDARLAHSAPLVLQEEALNPSLPPGDLPANEYERRAVAAALDGNYKSALRELVLGSMSWTERAGLIRFRRGLTNRDYIRACWRYRDRRDSLLHIVSAFERVFYGRRAANYDTFDACLVEFRKSFAQEPTDAPVAS